LKNRFTLRGGTPAQTVVVLAAALLVLVVVGDILGHLITGPLSNWVNHDLDIPARNFSTDHSSSGRIRAAQWIGTFGNVALTGLVAVVVGASWWIRTGNPRPALCLVSAFAGSGVLTVVIKYAVNRTPASGPLPSFSAGTFPSGHELFAVTVYGTLAVLAVRSSRSPRLRWPPAVAFALLAAGVGLARVYLLDHFLSDVIGSVVLGVAWIAIVSIVLDSQQKLGSHPSTRMRS
jgi:membrane-associated phospholipid phosphatase